MDLFLNINYFKKKQLEGCEVSKKKTTVLYS